jgi:hypothetical protein
MNRPLSPLRYAATIAGLLSVLGSVRVPAAEPPRVAQLRIQRAGHVTYFEVRLAAPRDLDQFEFPQRLQGTEAGRRLLSRLPALVPRDRQTSHVYPLVFITKVPDNLIHFPKDTLRFVGRWRGQGKARFLLGYPAETKKGKDSAAPQPEWKTLSLTIDFATARNVPRARKGRRHRRPLKNDLRRLWAIGQAARFAVLEAQAPDCGFYTFARLATRRKYHVRAWPLVRQRNEPVTSDHRQLYEMTTGATAVAESLQLRRLLSANFRDTGRRTIAIDTVPGITIAEHPWKKMMAGKKPRPEPLAKLVPNDNYYVRFRNVRKFIEFAELLDRWGTNLARAYELTSRDYRLRERYEKQLCLKSDALARALGPLVIRDLAITGSDGYLREGTDVTVIFQVVNRALFLAAVDKHLRAARREFGKQLKESKAVYHHIKVESFVTPLREVSLHRAQFGAFVVYSNSPAGVRRVIDTHQHRHKSLADSLDFQYMRTVFRADAKGEDGFAFLSNPFIRNLVGPASKIKEKRRLEALTSLAMTNYAALFSAWENGRLPTNHRGLLTAARLKPGEIYSPEGKGLAWDTGRKTAVSEVYNTVAFATPLVELPIDKVTPLEVKEYERFRRGYLTNWRRYFDPIGMRLTLSQRQVRLETYILPLIKNSRYDELRRAVGGGTAKLDLAAIPPKTLVQYFTHLSPELRNQAEDLINTWLTLSAAPVSSKKWLGEWFVLRFGDSPVYSELEKLWRRAELLPEMPNNQWDEMERIFVQLPVTVGIGIRDPKEFAKVLTALKNGLMDAESKILKPAYKNVLITRLRFDVGGLPKKLTIYHAMVGKGWYVSFSEAALKEVIDQTEGHRRAKKGASKGKLVKVNSSLYLAPKAVDKARAFLRSFLEWESHRRALANEAAWYALYSSGVIDKATSRQKRESLALQFFGFIPVSPEGAAYRYLPDRDEVENRRHGSFRRPRLHAAIEDQSPLGQLLREFRTLCVDLRFREDGVHTILTLERTPKNR